MANEIRARTYFLVYYRGNQIVKRKEFKHLPLLFYYVREHITEIRQHPEIKLAWHKQYEPYNQTPITYERY